MRNAPVSISFSASRSPLKSGLFLLFKACYSAAMVVRMRHTRSHTRNRRSHHALKAQALSVCECRAPRVAHRACPQCGPYKGRLVFAVAPKPAKKADKRAKREKSEAR